MTIRFVEKPLTTPLARRVDRRGLGVVPLLRLPAWLEVVVATVLLDYTLWIWHVLTHRLGFLWRFHEAHHADLDLDASTALRFHFCEMALSAPWRAGQVLLIGASPLSLSVWQTATLLAILFHHSNIRLPFAVERVLCRFLVTPRMHGIHHSVLRHETDSNWGTILSLPDYFHGTIRLNVPQALITIGVPGWRDPEELDLPDVVLIPFRPRAEVATAWGVQRPELGHSPTNLAP